MKFAVEPAAGEGAFLVPMAVRLIRSARWKGREPLECLGSLLAYELDKESADVARSTVSRALIEEGVPAAEAKRLVTGWVRVGDYLAEAAGLPRADFVVGNPPYIRLEDMPADFSGYYRSAYRTIKGRADLYVAFFEAALHQLAGRGVPSSAPTAGCSTTTAGSCGDSSPRSSPSRPSSKCTRPTPSTLR